MIVEIRNEKTTTQKGTSCVRRVDDGRILVTDSTEFSEKYVRGEGRLSGRRQTSCLIEPDLKLFSILKFLDGQRGYVHHLT